MKQSVKRLVSMFLALFFLAGAFVLFFELVQPEYNSVETLRGKLVAENGALTSEKALVAQAKSLLTSFNQGNSAQQSVALAVPDGQDIAGALAQIEGIAQNDNVSISSIGISAPALSQQTQSAGTAAGSSTAQVSPLGSFTLSLSGSGSYENFKSFLGQIETNIRIFDLKSLALSPAPVVISSGSGKVAALNTSATNDSFNYAMSIQTYYQIP